MYSYRCVFDFGVIYKTAWKLHEVIYRGDGIHAFTDGFWINDDLKFTKGSDCKYWIPPSQILYIEKFKGERDESQSKKE